MSRHHGTDPRRPILSPRNPTDVHARAESRDRGLRRVRTTTGWITVASAAGAVVLAGGYAQAMPGKTATAAPAAVPAHAGATTKPSAASSAGSGSGSSSSAPSAASTAPTTQAPSTQAPATRAPALQPPTQVPTTAASTAQTTSGGS
jgi:hypothetical protein